MYDREVEDATVRLLARYDIDALPIDVGNLSQLCDLDLRVWRGCPSEVSGFLFRGRHRTRIVINGNMTGTRRRFTIAHELAHWHYDDCQPLALLIDGDYGTEAWTERRANCFAAALLMPERIVREEVERQTSFAGMAWRFNVSRLALSYRLADLGLKKQTGGPAVSV